MKFIDPGLKKKKHTGTSIIFINKKKEVLLFLRDNKNEIPFPNCWDILGGHLEGNESPEECIIREIKEELGLYIKEPSLFKKYSMKDRYEYTFWQQANYDIKKIKLQEGQKLKWFSKTGIEKMAEEKIAFNFKPVLLEFFEKYLSLSGKIRGRG